MICTCEIFGYKEQRHSIIAEKQRLNKLIYSSFYLSGIKIYGYKCIKYFTSICRKKNYQNNFINNNISISLS